MNLDNSSDKEFIQYVLQAPRQELPDLLARYAGEERRRHLLLAEVQRRQMRDLFASSEAVKSLTRKLLWLTAVLALVALPPFVEAVKIWSRFLIGLHK